MKLNRIHAIIGFLLVIMPFLGFGRDFKYGFSITCGAVILYFAINSIHIELRKKHRKPHRHDTFVESKPMVKEERVDSEEEHLSADQAGKININKVDSVDIIENLEMPPMPHSSHIADAEENL